MNQTLARLISTRWHPANGLNCLMNQALARLISTHWRPANGLNYLMNQAIGVPPTA